MPFESGDIAKFLDLIRELQTRHVRFVMMGVGGANYYAATGGMTFTTMDRDLFLPPDTANELRAWEASEAAGLELWCGDEPLGIPMDEFLANALVERRMLVTALYRPANLTVDLSLVMANFEFEEIWANHRDFDVDGVMIPVASLHDIVESKRVANREKDRLFLATHAEALRQFFGEDE